MEFVARGQPAANAVALLPGAWNPPTRAHMAMAEAALEAAEEAVFVLARAMPHKPLEGPPVERRLAWLRAMSGADARLSAAVSDGGLFIEMARECRALTGAGRVLIVCGRDAAERAVGWDYGPGDSIERQLEEYELLVAPRGGHYEPPERLAARIHRLALPADWEEVSSTEARRRLRAGLPWEHLVPEMILEELRRAYQS